MHLDGKLSVRIKVGIARLRLLLLSRAIIGQATTDAQMSMQGSSSNVQGGCSQTTFQSFIEASGRYLLNRHNDLVRANHLELCARRRLYGTRVVSQTLHFRSERGIIVTQSFDL